MKSQTLTLTTIGLPVRTELRIKSLLEVVNSKTTHSWAFVDGTANVMICDPTSALSAIALKRSRTAVERCVSLVKDDETLPLPDTETLRDPIRAGDFVDLLNSVSATLEQPQQGQSGARAEPALDAEDPFRFGTTLRKLAKSGSNDVFMLQTGGFVAHVVPATRTVLTLEPIDSRTMQEITQPGVPVSVMQYPASYADQLMSNGAQRSSTDALLWSIGLHGPADRMLNELPQTGAFKLRRWPDFGRLEHSADHLRIAARLSRRESGLVELASSLGQATRNVTPFINACALCDLLKVAQPATAMNSPPPAPRAAPRTTYAGIFQTIRSVLGFGMT